GLGMRRLGGKRVGQPLDDIEAHSNTATRAITSGCALTPMSVSIKRNAQRSRPRDKHAARLAWMRGVPEDRQGVRGARLEQRRHKDGATTGANTGFRERGKRGFADVRYLLFCAIECAGILDQTKRQPARIGRQLAITP